MLELERAVGFDWDDDNARKGEKHGAGQAEAEQVFFDQKLLVVEDKKNSSIEQRFHALGITADGRRLHVTFTLRDADTLIRVISARDMHVKKGRSMSSKTKSVRKFKSEVEERAFWEANDSSNLVDWAKATRVNFPNLKISTQSISLRLPIHLLERIKVAANARDVPYQSLIKIWLEEKLSA